MSHWDVYKLAGGVIDPAPGCRGKFRPAGDSSPKLCCSRCLTVVRLDKLGQVIPARPRRGRRGQ